MMTDIFVFGLDAAPDFTPQSLQRLTVGLQACQSGSSQSTLVLQSMLAPKIARLDLLKPGGSLSTVFEPAAVQKLQNDHHVELVALPTLVRPPAPRPLRIAVFDMDSTLIEQEVIDELAATIGIGEQVAAITARAMRGELDFAGSLRDRVALLKGVRADVWDRLKTRITFARGARELCRGLRRLGVKMAVFSGGFQPMADWVKDELGLDEAVANELSTSPPSEQYAYEHLTGVLAAGLPIVTAHRKRILLEEFAAENNVPLSEALCVGDGANDLDMICAVSQSGGIGLAFKAKETVQQAAPNRLNTSSLADLLYLTGRDEHEVKTLCSG